MGLVIGSKIRRGQFDDRRKKGDRERNNGRRLRVFGLWQQRKAAMRQIIFTICSEPRIYLRQTRGDYEKKTKHNYT